MNRSLWQRRIWRAVVLALTMLGFTVLLVTFTPFVDWWGSGLAGPFTDPQGDTLIVLGGSSVSSDGVMGYDSYLRSEYAVRAWHDGHFRRVVLSGGGQPPVAAAMRQMLLSSAVPSDAIEVEPASMNTRENALFTYRLIGNQTRPPVLLTSDYHMFRARRCFQKVGLKVLPRPIPDVRKRAASLSGRWPAFLDLVIESGKIGYYFLRGWI